MQGTPDSRSNKRMRRILEVYYRGGADRVRAMLHRNAIPDEKIESILAHLQQNFPDLPITWPTASTHSQAFVHTVSVAPTGKSVDQLEWMYRFMRHDAPQARKALIEAAFFKAMAAIVRDRQAASHDPYKASFFDLAQAIAYWRGKQS